MDAARVPAQLIAARRAMVRRTIGPRRSGGSTRIVGGITVLVLSGAITWDLANDGFWSRHALFTGLVASLIAVAVTAAVLNEVLERRQRERWSVLAQYALWDLVRTARLVWTSLLELTGLVPDEELEDGVLAAGTEGVLARPRLTAAIDELLASPDRREQLHRLIARLHAQSREVLGRWADIMVNSGTYAEIVDRHVELYSLLYWWGSVLDESNPLEEHLDRPRLSRISLATRASIGQSRKSGSATISSPSLSVPSRSIKHRSNSRCASSRSTGGPRNFPTDPRPRKLRRHRPADPRQQDPRPNTSRRRLFYAGADQSRGPTAARRVAPGSHRHAKRDDMRLPATRANPHGYAQTRMGRPPPHVHVREGVDLGASQRDRVPRTRRPAGLDGDSIS
jgi:hypothetical protein